MSQYDAVCKYPNSELKTKLHSHVNSFLADVQTEFDKRENLTVPFLKFPPMPTEEVKIPELDHVLEVRNVMKKIVLSSLEEVQEADSHKLEDIGEVNFLLQQ